MTKQELDRLYNRVQQRKWREENPERSMEYNRQYLAKNRDHINKIHRKRKYLISKCFPHKWINVDDFLPEPDAKNDHEGDVLVFVPKRDGCYQHGIYLGKLRPVKADPEGKGNVFGVPTPGSEWTLWGWSYYERPIVTHWARLPQPPEGGEKGE